MKNCFLLIACGIKSAFIFPQMSVQTPVLLQKKITDSHYYIIPNNDSFLIKDNVQPLASKVIVGAERTDEYLKLLQHKRVAVFTNRTSIVRNYNRDNYIHLVDTLLRLNINITKVFVPEHGLMANQDAGEKIESTIDPFTHIPIVSLYSGEKKYPSDKDLKNIDVLIFDVQDVGARFYTYISSLQILIEKTIPHNVLFLVLDRPNPNGFYIDGPVLNKKYKSFVGKQTIPVVYGMTIGEYARMIFTENKMLKHFQKKAKSNVDTTATFKLEIITCLNYNHQIKYLLTIIPSPNLRTMQSIYLYPSLCLLEATKASVGRGTETPFEIYGFPEYKDSSFSFKPQKIYGNKNPPYFNIKCFGKDLTKYSFNFNDSANTPFTLKWIKDALQHFGFAETFFKPESFRKIIGNEILEKQLLLHTDEKKIKKTWQKDLEKFKLIRKKYLLYEDF